MVFRIDQCGTTLPGYPQIDTTPPPVEQLDRVLAISHDARFSCERITAISAAATVLSAVSRTSRSQDLAADITSINITQGSRTECP